MGIILLLLSALMGGIIILAPGSIRLQRPDCGWVGWAFNIMNLLFFMILTPVCSLIMIFELRMPVLLCIPMTSNLLHLGIEILGAFIFFLGAILLFWSRISLRRSFRLGGVKPSSTDYLTMHGPYKIMRHPMYLAVLLVLSGLTLILLSVLMAIMFTIMVFLIIRLIPVEEEQLDQAYPVAYAEYCRRVPGALFYVANK